MGLLPHGPEPRVSANFTLAANSLDKKSTVLLLHRQGNGANHVACVRGRYLTLCLPVRFETALENPGRCRANETNVRNQQEHPVAFPQIFPVILLLVNCHCQKDSLVHR